MVLTPTELITYARQIVMPPSKPPPPPQDRGGHPVDYYGIVLKHGVYQDEYRCEVCEVPLTGVVPLRQHLVSHKHGKHIKPHLPERNQEVQNAMYQLEEQKHAHHMNSYPQHEQQQQWNAQFDVSQMRPFYPTSSYQPQPTVFQPQQQPQQKCAGEPGYNLPLQQHKISYSDEDGIDFRPGDRYQYIQYHCQICNVFMPSETNRDLHILEKDHLDLLHAHRSRLHPGNLQQHAQPDSAQMGSRHSTHLYHQEYQQQLQSSTELIQLHQQYQQPAFNAPQQQQNSSYSAGFAIPQPPQQWIQQQQQPPLQQAGQQQQPGLQPHPSAFGYPAGPPVASLLPPAAYLSGVGAISGSLLEKEPMNIKGTTELIELGEDCNATFGRGRSRGRATPRNLSPTPTVSLGRGRGRCLPSLLAD